MNPPASKSLLVLLGLAAAFGLASTWWLHQGPPAQAGAGANGASNPALAIGSRTGPTEGAPVEGISISSGALMATSLPDPDGKAHALAEWSGKPMVINFWATWCDPCREEMPLLTQAAQRPELRDAAVLGIALDDAGEVRKFVAEHKLGFPVLIDADSVGQALAVRLGDSDGALPFTALVDRRGVVVEVRRGPWKPGELEARLAHLLKS